MRSRLSFLSISLSRFLAPSLMWSHGGAEKSGSALKIASSRSSAVSPSNGSRHASRMYAMTPSAHTSASGPLSPRNTSGAMYACVPTMSSNVCPGSYSALSPKSIATSGESSSWLTYRKFSGCAHVR